MSSNNNAASRFTTREVPLPDDFDPVGPPGPPPAIPPELWDALNRDPPVRNNTGQQPSRSSLSTPRTSHLPAIPTSPLGLEANQFSPPPAGPSRNPPSSGRPSTSPVNSFRSRLGKQKSRDELTSVAGAARQGDDNKPGTPQVIPPTPSPQPEKRISSTAHGSASRRSLKKAASVEELGTNNGVVGLGLQISPVEENGERRDSSSSSTFSKAANKVLKHTRANRGRGSDTSAVYATAQPAPSLSPSKMRRHSLNEQRPYGFPKTTGGSSSLDAPSSSRSTSGGTTTPQLKIDNKGSYDLLEIDETDDLRWPTQEKFVHDLFRRRQRRRSRSRARKREGDTDVGGGDESDSGASDLMSESDAASDLLSPDDAELTFAARSSLRPMHGQYQAPSTSTKPSDPRSTASGVAVPLPTTEDSRTASRSDTTESGGHVSALAAAQDSTSSTKAERMAASTSHLPHGHSEDKPGASSSNDAVAGERSQFRNGTTTPSSSPREHSVRPISSISFGNEGKAHIARSLYSRCRSHMGQIS
jgi:hypothetical protein